MKRVLILSLLVSVLLGSATCASVPLAESAPGESFITLRKEPENDYWRVTWHLAEPASAIAFERRAAGIRPEVFEILTSGFSFEMDGEHEILRGGAPVRTISARIREFSRPLPKDYELFQRFSDGSVAIYTGHFVARPVMGDDAEDDCEECWIRTFRLDGPQDASVVVGGTVHESPFEWTDTHEQGTYVYFGSLQPVATDDMISIVDPALPDWLEKETKSALPRLFELYAERLGVDLPDRPTILFNYLGNDLSGYSSSGGTLPGLIQMTVQGEGWDQRSDDAMLHLFHFFAHEAAHLWNGQIVNYPDAEDSWMHEGSADALAERALLELGLIDEERFLEYQTAALNECRRGLGGFPLRDAAERGDFFLYYSCGNVIALATEAATDEENLFAFWRTLIYRALESGRYMPEDYFAVWRDLGAEGEEIALLRDFVATAAEGEKLVSMIERQGIGVVTDEDPPQTYGQPVARDALLALLSEHCKGRYGFNASQKGLELSDGLDCGPIEGGGAVSAIGGFDVLREGHRTWDVLHEHCGTDRPVPITIRSANGDVHEIELMCSTGKPARPPYLRIKSR